MSVRRRTSEPSSARATPLPWSGSSCAASRRRPPSREIHKTALGAEQTVAWEYAASTGACIDELHAAGYTVLAVEQVEGAVMLDRFAPEEDVRYALVFGNEVEGVGQEAVDRCDGAIEIPQAGTKHSLNVSVSGGVVLWRFFDRMGPKR